MNELNEVSLFNTIAHILSFEESERISWIANWEAPELNDDPSQTPLFQTRGGIGTPSRKVNGKYASWLSGVLADRLAHGKYVGWLSKESPIIRGDGFSDVHHPLVVGLASEALYMVCWSMGMESHDFCITDDTLTPWPTTITGTLRPGKFVREEVANDDRLTRDEDRVEPVTDVEIIARWYLNVSVIWNVVQEILDSWSAPAVSERAAERSVNAPPYRWVHRM